LAPNFAWLRKALGAVLLLFEESRFFFQNLENHKKAEQDRANRQAQINEDVLADIAKADGERD